MNPELYESGFVQRWHTHPTLARLGQTLGHHQWGVATLIAQLHDNPSASLLMAALWHDVGEFETGDIPYMSKAWNSALAYESQKSERRAAIRITQSRLIQLHDEEADWLYLCDRLEAYLYVKTVAPHLLEDQDWKNCLEGIFEIAEDLGVYDVIEELLE